MKDAEKSKEQLIKELEGLRTRVAQLEKIRVADRKSGQKAKHSKEALGAEHDRVEGELKRKNDELQLILDSVPALIYYKDKDGRMLNMNKATASLTDVPKEKLLQKTVFQLMPDSADRYHKDDMEVITSGKAKMNIEEPLELPDNKRWLKTDKLPIKDSNGNVTGLIGFSIDITERKMAEESLRKSEEKLRVMFEAMTDGVVVTDLNTKVVDVNKAALKIFGYGREEVIGRNGLEILAFEQQDEAVQTLARNLEGTEITGTQEYTLMARDGRSVNTEININRLSDIDGNPYGFVTVVRDVTARKQAEEALRQSEEKYRALAENTNDIVYIVNAEGVIQYISPQVRRYGFEPEQFISGNILDFIIPEDRDRMAFEYMKTMSTGEEFTSQFRTKDAKGEIRWLEDVSKIQRDAAGKATGLAGVLRDITERRQAEEALRQSEERYRLMAENMSDVIWVIGSDMKYQYMSPSVTRMGGFTPEEMMAMPFEQALTRESFEHINQALIEDIKADKTGKRDPHSIRTLELQSRNKDGSTMWVEIKITLLHDQHGKLAGFMGVTRDINERKKAQEALKESEERYRLIAENMSDVIWIMNLDLEYQYVSPSIERMRGFTVYEAMAMKPWEYISEESLKTATTRLAEELEAEKRGGVDPDRVTTINMEVMNKDGSWMWIEARTSFLRDSEGKPIGLLGVSRDITERRMAQEALRESEEKLRVVFDSMGDATTVVDLRNNIIDCNEAALRLHGFGSKSELIGRKASELVAAVDRERAIKDSISALNAPYESGRAEYRLLTRDGREFDGEFGVSIMKDKQGRPAGFIGLAHDISERKAAAEALRKSEEKYRLLFESSLDGKAIVDAETNEIMLANETALKLFGFSSKAELEGINIFDYIHPADKERIAEAARNNIMFKGDSASLGEVRTLTMSGEVKWILVSGILSEYDGRPAGLTSFVDITERKRAEEALRKSEEKYRDLVEKERDVIFSVDALGFITSMNPAVRNWGYTVEEILGKNFIELIPKEWQEKTAIELQNALVSSGELTAETRVIHKSGEVLPIEYSAMVIKEGGVYAGAQGVVRDVSERKRAEEALRQSEEKFRVLFESIPDGISVIELKTGKLTDTNPAALHMFGYERDDVVGSDAFNLIAEKDRMKAFDDMQNTLVKGRSSTSEWCLLGKGGKEFDCEATAAVIKDSSGAPTLLVNVIRDVTERKRIEKELDDYRNNLEKMVQERTSELIRANRDLKHEIAERQRAENELRASEEKLRLIFDSIGEGLVITDLEGVVKELNDDAVRIIGYDSKEELIGRNCMEPIADADRERAIHDQMRMLESGIGKPGEYRFIRKDGSEFAGELRGAVLKDSNGNPIELLGVFRDITERKQAEEALRESEEKYRTLFEDSQDSVMITTIGGRIQDFNSSLSKLVGYSREELLELNAIRLYMNPGDRETLKHEIKSTGAVRDYAVKWVRKDGERLDVLMTLTARYDAGGDMIGYQGIVHDITERKRAENALRESEARSRAILEAMPDLIFQMGADGVFLDYKGPTEGLLIAPSKFIGKRIAEAMPGDIAEMTMQSIGNVLSTGQIQQYSYELRLEEQPRYFDARMAAVNEETVLVIVRDMTERKMMEDALKMSEEKLRGIFNSIIDSVVLTDLEFNILDLNDAALEFVGSGSKEELIGTKAYDLLAPEDLGRLMATLPEAVEGHPLARSEGKIISKLGKEICTDISVSMYKDPSGRQAGFVAVVKDITEHKRMEDALRDSEEKLRVMFSSMADGVVVTDLEGKITDLNEAQLRMFRYESRDEIVGRGGFDFIVERERDRAFKEMIKVFEVGYNIGSTFKVADSKGKEFECELSTALLHDAEGKASGFITVMRDVTERKRMEEALRDSEEKLRFMFKSIIDAVVVVDLEGRILEVNDAGLLLTGYGDKDDLVGINAFDFIVEEDRERAFTDMTDSFKVGAGFLVQYRFKNRQGKISFVEARGGVVYNASGEATGFIVIVRDISERRHMEQALRDSEEKLRIIFESIGDGITVTDLEGIIIETNEAAARLGGWADKTQLIGMSGFDFVAESERGRMVSDMIKALQEQRSINVEYSVKDKDGREYQSDVNVTLLRDAAGNPKGIVSVVRDITERKRMEQDLRDSEEMSRGMIESAATAVCIVKDGQFAYVSPMFAEMSGYTVDDLIGTRSTDYIHEEDRDYVMREAVANLKGENIAPHEYRLLRKDGSYIWILEKIASIQYKGERAAIGSLLDITRLKQVEEALRDSEEKLRLIFASLPDGVTVTDMTGSIIEENEAGVSMSGLTSKEQVIGRNGFDFIAANDRDKALADLPKIFETGVSGPLEYRMVKVDGSEYDGEIIAAMMRDKAGNPQGFITVVRDVTERKRAREELQESQEMMRGMLESAATGIYMVQDGKFKYVNPQFMGISGYAPEDLLDSDSMSYIHPDDRDAARLKVIENLKGISDQPHEFRFIKKDGESTWILERVASIEYKGRRAAIGSFMDISERKRIEEMLRQRSLELEQRTNQLLALQKITASIQSTLDLKEILQQVANGVVHNLGFDHSLIIKVDEAFNVARGMVFATKYDASKVGEIQEIIGKGLTEIEIPQVRGYNQVVDNAMDGKATISHDFFEISSSVLSRNESDAVTNLLGVKTTVLIPLFARERHVGSILALTDQEEVSNVLLEPLRILSDQAGVAVENADLYHGVSEYAQRLSVITALSKILGSSLDIKGVYKAFSEEVRKVMDFDRTSIAMVEGDKLRYFVVAEDVETELKDGSELPLSDSATSLVVKTKRTLIEPDFDQEMKFPIDHMYYRSGLRSAIRVPLFSGGEVFATFNLASKKPNSYGEREREILEQISGSLTAAIENSRLYSQVRQHEAELLKAYEDLKSAQAYMVQSEKLRALGEMAGGVAHDFNNILAVVLGRTQLALEDVKDEKLKKDLQVIEQTAIDAATTVRRLQDFARVRVERNFEVLDLKEVMESALQMADSRRVKLKEREGITVDIESKLGVVAPVEGDAAELREGLLNIIFNAMDAMPDGGKITIKATQTKKWVTLSINDTGIGMPDEVRKKIFEPFFTTRTHKGTGLGLAVTYGIVQRHRGEIWVESKEGVGSTFYIKLPVCGGVVSKKAAAAKASTMKSLYILMVDDNPEVAGVLGLTLKRLGHRVVEANSGEAAINTFEVSNFDLVITDLGMPDMSGHEVAKIVKEIKPGTPVLVISGWGGQLNLDEMPEVDGVIAKPFSKEVLSEKIAALLSGEGTRSGKGKGEKPKKKKIDKSALKKGESDKGKTGIKKVNKKKGM